MQRSPLVRWSSWALWSCFLCSGLKVQVPSFTADVPFLLLLADVGFTPGVELSVNITSSEPGAVFLLLSSTQLHDWLHGPPREDTDGNLSSYFASQWRQPLSRQLSARIDLDLPKVDFFYAGIFDPTFNAETPKKYKIDLDFVNAHGQHLPVQWAKLPLMWAISSIAFSFFVQGAVILTSTTWYRSSTPLHGLLMLCAALKAIELVVRAELFRVLSLAGDAPPWKLKVWRLLHYVTDTFELLVMVAPPCVNSYTVSDDELETIRGGRAFAMSLLEESLGGDRIPAGPKVVDASATQDSNESYFVMGTSVRRTNSQGTKTFEKYLRWEDRWDAISWGPHQRPLADWQMRRLGQFYLDTPQPQDETVHWSAYKRGAKPFRWNRPRPPVVLIPTKPQPKARPKSQPTEPPPVPKLAPKPKKRPQQSPQQVEGALRRPEPVKVPGEVEGAKATKTSEVIPAAGASEMVEEVQLRLDESTLLGAEPGWERERLIARSLLSRGFRPTDPESHSDEEAEAAECWAG
eukprot:s662_g29.t1